MLDSLGQGGCQAIEDAAALAEALDAGPDAAAALQAYGARRMPAAAAAARRSRAVTRLAPIVHRCNEREPPTGS
jgi:2-polyprenyl-6-methoxyphenol hydroxylase-like FAD-dependent oxidoreductase